MYVNFFLKPMICFEGEGAGGGGAGADTVAAGAGADTISAGAGADTLAAGAGADTVASGADPATAKWWEGDKFKEHRDLLEAKGLTLDDKDDVIAKLAKSEKAAQLKLGKPADQLLTKPGKDETVADWMKTNGEMFGIPESADKYDIKKRRSTPWSASMPRTSWPWTKGRRTSWPARTPK